MADLADTSLVPGKGRFTGDLPPISPKGRAIIAVDGAMLILAILWTAMRVWVRRQKEMSILFVEDIFCYFALVRLGTQRCARPAGFLALTRGPPGTIILT